MSLSSLSVRRPVATAMFYIALTTIGFFAFNRLQVDVLPKLDFPSISVVTTYAGVSPEEMETLITRPIEEAVARVEGIDRIESFSSEGRSRVALRFVWGVPLESALNDVRAAVERARARLPDEAEPPVVYKFDLASFPILNLGLEAPGMDEGRVRRFAETVVKPRLERVAGVAAVEVRGAREREIRVELDATRMAAVDVDAAQVIAALRAGNLTVPAGVVESGDDNILVRAMSEAESLEQIADLMVVTRGDQPIRVRDVAVVNDDYEEIVNVVRINGEPGVQLLVTKSPDANTVEVADAMYGVIEQFNEDFADQAQLEITSDSSTFIRRSISSVQSGVLIGAVLALGVIIAFLRSIRLTLIIGIAIPISIIATFLLMYAFDLTLNLISFGGLALGTGMLVDNSIVILENIFRRREQGDDAITAAMEGSREVAGAVVSSTLTTVAVFAPVIFLGGFSAIFFGQMAMVVTSSLACSLLVALTIVPVLASILLRHGFKQSSKRTIFDSIDDGYASLASGAVRHPYLVLLAAIALLVGSLFFARGIGTELMPESDESEVAISIEHPPGTRIEVTADSVERVEQIIRDNVPEVSNVIATVGTPGFWSTSGEESANMRLNLVPVEERTRSSAEIADSLRPLLAAALPGVRAFARPGSGLWILNFIRGGDERLRVEIRGFDLEESDRLAAEVTRLMGEVEGVSDARASRRTGGRELRLYVDRERAADYGLTTRSVADALSTLVQGTRAGVFREDGDEFNILVRLSANDLASFERVLATPYVLPNGDAVPISTLVRQAEGRTPQAIERLDQERIVTVSASAEEGYDLGTLSTQVREQLASLDVPDEFTVAVAGESAEQKSTFGSLLLGLLLAVALVYMVMAAQFESLAQPAIIMISVPFAAIGVVSTLHFTDTTLNLYSFLGIIVLIGIVVNNAIVLVDYTNMLRNEQGMELYEAVVESARRRLRPILMTTGTTVLALIPVALGSETGGETQAPLARVVAGGLTSSTLITLFVVPVLYVLLERSRRWLSRKFGGVILETPAVAPAPDSSP